MHSVGTVVFSATSIEKIAIQLTIQYFSNLKFEKYWIFKKYTVGDYIVIYPMKSVPKNNSSIMFGENLFEAVYEQSFCNNTLN